MTSGASFITTPSFATFRDKGQGTMHVNQTARGASNTPLRVSDRPGAKPIAVTIPDARRLTGLGTTKIYELIAQAKLKSVAIGRRRLVIYSSIEDLLQTGDEAA